MPWRRRHHLPDDVFTDQRHIVSITICTAEKRRWLKIDSLADVVRDEILRIHQNHPVLGFCVMPDHVHLLLCNATVPVSKIMNLFKGRTSYRIRKTHPTLQVWQRGYWDHIVRRQEGLYTVLQYIFQNPVRAGLVEYWWDYLGLGSPMLGPVGPDFFGTASPEDIMWSEILRV